MSVTSPHLRRSPTRRVPGQQSGSTSTLADRRRAARKRLAIEEPRRSGRWGRSDGERVGVSGRAPLGPAPVAYYVIVVVVSVFVMLGLVMVLSSTAANEVAQGNSAYRVFSRQVLWAGLGFIGLLAAARIPPQRWRPFVWPIAVLSTAAMLLPFVPGLGVTINDTRAWIHLGRISLQPSEILKLAALALTAEILTRRHAEIGDARRALLPVVVIAGGGASLCLIQGDLGSAAVLGSIILGAGFIAGIPVRWLFGVVAAGLGFFALFIVSSPRRVNRFTSFLDVRGNREYTSYQTYQGFLSMANGGLTGSGIGGSNGKLGYLPLAHSDFIFAVIADELGFIGAVAVVGGFALLVWFGIQTALAAPDRFGMILAGGIATWFGVQAFVNLGGVSGLIPVTGLTLPFFSVGGTSLFVMMTATGLLLHISRRAV